MMLSTGLCTKHDFQYRFMHKTWFSVQVYSQNMIFSTGLCTKHDFYYRVMHKNDFSTHKIWFSVQVMHKKWFQALNPFIVYNHHNIFFKMLNLNNVFKRKFMCIFCNTRNSKNKFFLRLPSKHITLQSTVRMYADIFIHRYKTYSYNVQHAYVLRATLYKPVIKI